MELIVDFIVEYFLTLFVEGFISLYSVFVPNKILTEEFRKKITSAFLIISLILLIGLFIGTVVLIETNGSSIIAWIFVSLSFLYIVFGIILRVISVIKKKL